MSVETQSRPTYPEQEALPEDDSSTERPGDFRQSWEGDAPSQDTSAETSRFDQPSDAAAEVTDTRTPEQAQEDAAYEARHDGPTKYEGPVSERVLRRVADFLHDKADTREGTVADRQETIDNAKEAVKGFGRASMNRLKQAGRIGGNVAITGLGLGILAGEALGRGVKSAAENTKNAVTNTVESAKTFKNEKVEAARNFIKEKRDAAQERKHNRIQNRKNEQLKKDYEKEKKAKSKEAIKNREAAQAAARRAARQAKWAARRETVTDAGKDAARATREAAAKVRKTTGDAATRKYKQARAAGQGAVDGWKSVEK